MVTVNEASSDSEIRTAYRTLSLTTHPDRGGLLEDQQSLNDAYEAWRKIVLGTSVIAESSTSSSDNARQCARTTNLVQVTWQYRNSSGDKWINMDRSYVQKHEEQYQLGARTFEYDVYYGKKKDKVYQYIVDFNEMTQMNRDTGKVRRIRRLVAVDDA